MIPMYGLDMWFHSLDFTSKRTRHNKKARRAQLAKATAKRRQQRKLRKQVNQARRRK